MLVSCRWSKIWCMGVDGFWMFAFIFLISGVWI